MDCIKLITILIYVIEISCKTYREINGRMTLNKHPSIRLDVLYDNTINCTSKTVKCRNGNCVSRHHLMDGVNDCMDYSDEVLLADNCGVDDWFRCGCEDNNEQDCKHFEWIQDDDVNCKCNGKDELRRISDPCPGNSSDKKTGGDTKSFCFSVTSKALKTSPCTCSDSVANSECRNSKCTCKHGFAPDQRYMNCVPLSIGDRCTNDHDCSLLDNSNCSSDQNKKWKRCTCNHGYITHLLPSGLKDCNLNGASRIFCEDSSECEVNSYCENSVCNCVSSYKESEPGTCVKKGVGDKCQRNADCAFIKAVRVLVAGKCDSNSKQCSCAKVSGTKLKTIESSKFSKTVQFCSDGGLDQYCFHDDDCSLEFSECHASLTCGCAGAYTNVDDKCVLYNEQNLNATTASPNTANLQISKAFKKIYIIVGVVIMVVILLFVVVINARSKKVAPRYQGIQLAAHFPRKETSSLHPVISYGGFLENPCPGPTPSSYRNSQFQVTIYVNITRVFDWLNECIFGTKSISASFYKNISSKCHLQTNKDNNRRKDTLKRKCLLGKS